MNTLFLNPLIQAYTSNAPDPFYSRYSDAFNPTSAFNVDQKIVKSIALDLADVYVFTPGDLQQDNGCIIVVKVVGAARIKTTGVDTDLSTAIVSYLPTYGTETLPGYAILSTFNASAFEILGQADDTTVELFYGSKEDIVASNIGLVTQASRLYASAVPLTTAVPVNVTNSPGSSISLAAGSYEVRGCVAFQPSGAVVTRFNACVSVTSATEAATSTIALPNTAGEVSAKMQAGTAFAHTELTLTLPTYVLVVPANTTAVLYLVATATFGSGTCSASGWLEARKVL